MNLRVSQGVREKLETKHGVTIAEVEECFATRIYDRYGHRP